MPYARPNKNALGFANLAAPSYVVELRLKIADSASLTIPIRPATFARSAWPSVDQKDRLNGYRIHKHINTYVYIQGPPFVGLEGYCRNTNEESGKVNLSGIT